VQLDASFGQSPLVKIGFEEVHEIHGNLFDELENGIGVSFSHSGSGRKGFF